MTRYSELLSRIADWVSPDRRVEVEIFLWLCTFAVCLWGFGAFCFWLGTLSS